MKERESHETYGVAQCSRVSHSDPQTLFGSTTKHYDGVVLRISTASIRGNRLPFHYFPEDNIIEVEMSSLQFSEMITSMNLGSGVPVTIRRINGKRLGDCPFIDQEDILMENYKNHLQKKDGTAVQMIEKATDILKNKKTFSKKDREELLSLLDSLYTELKPNKEYYVKKIQEIIDTVKSEAKAEIEATMQTRIQEIALKALAEKGVGKDVSMQNYLSTENDTEMKCEG